MALNHEQALSKVEEDEALVLDFVTKVSDSSSRGQVFARICKLYEDQCTVRKGVEWDQLNTDEQFILGLAGKVSKRLGFGK